MRRLPLTVFYLLLGTLAASEKKYILPLRYFSGISSSFMDYRTGHFHGGVDFRTGKKTGMPVLAVSDGRIVKLSMLTTGTGRTLFLQHKDGNTSIYYHLERFNDRIDALVKTIQEKRQKRYFGEYLLPEPIEVKQGEQIAWSGESGAGFPHLHFELRNSKDVVLNPFFWLEIPPLDIYPPVAKGILVRTRERTLINGKIGEFYFSLKKHDQLITLTDPLFIDGPFDLILHLFDPTDCRKTGAPYFMEALFDDTPFYRYQGDEFSWEDHNQLGMVFDVANSSTGVFFYNLIAQPGFRLERTGGSLVTLIKNASAGPHSIHLRLRDQFRNETIATIPVVKVIQPDLKVLQVRFVDNRLHIEFNLPSTDPQGFFILEIFDTENEPLVASGEIPWKSTTVRRMEIPLSGRNRPAYGEFRFYRDRKLCGKKTFRITDPEILPPSDPQMEVWLNQDDILVTCNQISGPVDVHQLQVTQGTDKWTVDPIGNMTGVFFSFKPRNQVMDIDLSLLSAGVAPQATGTRKRIPVIVVMPEMSARFQRGPASIDFHPRSVRERKTLLFYQTETESVDGFLAQVSASYALLPIHVPFFDRVMIRIEMPNPTLNPKQIGLFRQNHRSGRWQSIQTNLENEAVFTAQIRSGGIFALFRDDLAPELNFLPSGRKSIDSTQPLLVRVREIGKGIDVETIFIRLNGREPDWEYDGDRAQIRINDRSLLKKGRNELGIAVIDHAGNQTWNNWPFYF